MEVRAATDADLPAIRRLYNALIPTTTVAWREDLADEAELARWFADRAAAGDPVLVAEVDGEVVGYTCWSLFRHFPGYRHTRELTIHVDGSWHGGGVGRALIEALVAEGRAAGVHVLVAAVDADNVGSIAFHEALGFQVVARMPEVGRKFDRARDLVLLQRIVD